MKKRISIVVILLTLWLALPVFAAAPSVSLGNGVLELSVGQSVPLPVRVADVQDLYGFEMHLRFDPAVVQVADSDPGTSGVQVAPGDFLSADFVVQNRADNQAGTIDFAVTQLNPSEPKSGSGTLFTVYFQGIAADKTSRAEAANGAFATRDAVPIEVSIAGAEIKVIGALAAGGSPTTSPTSELPITATPTTPPASAPTSGGDAPTATRAFTNTPAVAGSGVAPLAQPSATPDHASAGANLTQPVPPALAAATQPAQAPAAGPVEVLGSATPVLLASAAVETPFAGPTTAASQPTPELVAKKSSGNTGKAILGPDASVDPNLPQETYPDDQPAYSGLLIGAGVLLGIAVLAAAVLLGLALRHRRA